MTEPSSRESAAGPCSDAGPRVVVTARGWANGKYRGQSAYLDLEIHNPLAQATWFLLTDPLLEPLAYARINRAGVYPAPDVPTAMYVWLFSGSSYVEAIRVGPEATVVLRNVKQGASPGTTEPEMRFVFASDILVAGIRAEERVGLAGVTTTRDVVLGDEWMRAGPLRECGNDLAELVPLSVRELCRQTVRCERFRVGPCPDVTPTGLP